MPSALSRQWCSVLVMVLGAWSLQAQYTGPLPVVPNVAPPPVVQQPVVQQPVIPATPEVSNWKLMTTLGAGFTSVTLINWAGGGENQIIIRGLVMASADYAFNTFRWDNDLDVGYGLLKIGDGDFRKSDDRLVLTSKASFKQSDAWRYTAFLDLRSQIALGLNHYLKDPKDPTKPLKVSDAMAPAYITTALGAEWTPATQFRMLVTPLSAKTTLVLDNDLAAIGSFGVEKGLKVDIRAGMIVNATLDWEFIENVTWRSRFNGFARYRTLDLWAINVENAFVMKVNTFMTVSLLTDIIYDDHTPVKRDDGTTGPSLQLRNQLMLNFQFKFEN